ncbi:MAG: DUF2721 domain-containing protein [Spirochaetota bacterium]
MEFTFATPALLFPAVSLLFISFTNRFVSYADLVRRLHERWRTEGSTAVAQQISNLRKRIVLIRNMQIAGAFSLLFCTACMILLFFEMTVAAETLFAGALFLMLVSLALLVVEVSISVRALGVQLSDLEAPRTNASPRRGD